MKKIQCMFIAVLCAALLCSCGKAPSNADVGESQNPASAAHEPAADAAPPEIIEPEQLISKQEAEELAGEAMLDGEKTDNPVVGQKLCFYDAADEDSQGFLQIGLTQQAFMPEGSANTPESIYTTTRDYGDGCEVVEGIGYEAIVAGGGYYILYDGYMVSVNAGNTDNETTKDILKEAGLLAVKNLKTILGQ